MNGVTAVIFTRGSPSGAVALTYARLHPWPQLAVRKELVMPRRCLALLVVVLAVMLPASLAVAQNPPSLPPGTPLPPGFQLPPGWTYDQATGQFRPASTPAASGQPATASTCADLRTQTTTLEHDTQGLQRQAQDALNRLHDAQRKLADAQKQRDLVCAAA